MMRSSPAGSHWYTGGLSVSADLDRVYTTIRDTKGKLDIVFANAGVLVSAPLGQITEDMVDLMLSTNLKDTIFTVKAQKDRQEASTT
jgi:NAD(P)-dependent dehydrogenase (short-subunit alcohol dehydrogenase family)